jgi:hypothetical protein
MSGAEIGLRIWRKVRAERGTAAHAWFVRRFTIAATVVIDRWRPSWARRRVGAVGSLGGMDTLGTLARALCLDHDLGVVISMWKLLGELAVRYCELAAWTLAAGHEDWAATLIEKADACLVQRGWHKGPEKIGLADVLRER